MPERSELDYEYEDDESAYDLDEEATGYEDDEEYGEYEEGDEEYDEEAYDEDEEPRSGGWQKPAIFAVVALMVAGAGGYFFLSDGNIPFMAKKEPAPAASPFATSGFGKVAKAPAEAPTAKPAAATPQPVQATPAAVAPPEPVSEAPQPVQKNKFGSKPAQVVTEPAETHDPIEPLVTKPQAKPVVKAPAKVVAKPKPAAVARPKPAAKAPAKVATAPRRYAVQVGSFADAGNANSLVAALKAKGYSDAYIDGGGSISAAFTVRSTLVDSTAKANELSNQFAAAGHPATVVNLGKGKYAVQLGIYASRASADNLASELNSQGLFVSVASGQTKRVGATRVRVGSYPSLAAANQVAAKLRAEGVPAIPVKR